MAPPGRKSRNSEFDKWWAARVASLTSISALIEQSAEISEPEDLTSERDLYFELLELQPIRLSLSFERTDRLSGEK